MNNLKTYKEFKQIFENDNVAKSTKTLDRFGITDFKRFPIELENVLREEGFSDENAYERSHLSMAPKEGYFDKQYIVDGKRMYVELYLFPEGNDYDKDAFIMLNFNYELGTHTSTADTERKNYLVAIDLVKDMDNIINEMIALIDKKDFNNETVEKLLSNYKMEVSYTG